MSTFVLVSQGGDECDFCSSRPVFKVYSCRNFLVPWTKHWVFQHESETAVSRRPDEICPFPSSWHAVLTLPIATRSVQGAWQWQNTRPM